jgi:hypothetical protein
MSQHHIESRFQVRAPAAVIWKALADSSSWPTWSPNDEVTIEKPGVPAPDGVGAVRKLRTGKIKVTEEITVFEPERRVGYRLVKGLPVKDYRADVVLSRRGDGSTDLVWSADFKGVWGNGKWAQRKLQQVLDEWGGALARHAEKVATS